MLNAVGSLIVLVGCSAANEKFVRDGSLLSERFLRDHCMTFHGVLNVRFDLPAERPVEVSHR